jgi:hypothetical protein
MAQSEEEEHLPADDAHNETAERTTRPFYEGLGPDIRATIQTIKDLLRHRRVNVTTEDASAQRIHNKKDAPRKSKPREDSRHMIERKDGNKKLTEPCSHKESETRLTTKSHKPFPHHGCKHCGDIEYHDFQFCSNRGIRCEKCDFIGHNAASCFSKKRVKEKIRRDKENRDQKNTRDKSMVNHWKGDRSRSSAANERRKSRRHQEYEIAPPRTQEREGTTYSPVRNGSVIDDTYLETYILVPRAETSQTTWPPHTAYSIN